MHALMAPNESSTTYCTWCVLMLSYCTNGNARSRMSAILLDTSICRHKSDTKIEYKPYAYTCATPALTYHLAKLTSLDKENAELNKKLPTCRQNIKPTHLRRGKLPTRKCQGKPLWKTCLATRRTIVRLDTAPLCRFVLLLSFLLPQNAASYWLFELFHCPLKSNLHQQALAQTHTDITQTTALGSSNRHRRQPRLQIAVPCAPPSCDASPPPGFF